MMKLFTKAQYQKLLANGRTPIKNRKPVVKLFTPDAPWTWLLSELDPEIDILAFGLCDLGLGCPELGRVNLLELHQFRGNLGLPVERDRTFIPQKTLLDYAEEARQAGHIKA